MKPEESTKHENQGELFRNRSDQIIDPVVSNRDQFVSDNLMKRAFVRSIEILGEASNKLSDL
ncbi:hypothetical protein BWD12_19725 [Leptospira santarosai serovar Bananal]|uniref:Uncharacterized protein n=1 Tax=Leptospira santarosai TaxID=28183 RepID=A0AB73NDC2_9LEPT|nr:hypothetical protein B2G51_00185 [Leptospira santarosai]OLY59959.1 hypothetical protein BV917_13200 [Leptospira santarosai serovar Guaricura]OLY63497.1 hypothetical protein BWD11_14230 [Leptospira santarosai serovar Grippotyphosa]ONF75998.1 hypothetical protein BWD12_19725 [Leptospira santarosai serovar Bananal]MBW9231864.1 DUF86 domain-containing protein [Leptospira santarosai]